MTNHKTEEHFSSPSKSSLLPNYLPFEGEEAIVSLCYSRKDWPDGIVHVPIGGAAQQLPEAILSQNSRVLLLFTSWRRGGWANPAGTKRRFWPGGQLPSSDHPHPASVTAAQLFLRRSRCSFASGQRARETARLTCRCLRSSACCRAARGRSCPCAAAPRWWLSARHSRFYAPPPGCR